ncbi:excalibur calcium-binding domain-containing protein [Mycobacterium mantenii]|uniref:Excalibur calcium-binding domain-containing protein n=1 Tax=Mycobacterium mantenii TaxID=560555 RepID=A0A1A2T1V2_MYCNT|nr:excalibur calcium-binding domain-containing protein [Mycobacterium mantenii]OBH43379.1 hypothetical protein A5688_12680 [Mycobacterium mantenii]OBH70404.1 hypothetical protein A5683_00325 [Mycobacterium mantenii]
MFKTPPTRRLSEATRDKLAKVVAAVLIAIIVVCVIVVVWTLIQDGAIRPRPGPRSTPAPTATIPRSSVYYRNCAEAHAAGRWDIPEGDPAYRPGLDKDHNGVACESRKTSRLAGR